MSANWCASGRAFRCETSVNSLVLLKLSLNSHVTPRSIFAFVSSSNFAIKARLQHFCDSTTVISTFSVLTTTTTTAASTITASTTTSLQPAAKALAAPT